MRGAPGDLWAGGDRRCVIRVLPAFRMDRAQRCFGGFCEKRRSGFHAWRVCHLCSGPWGELELSPDSPGQKSKRLTVFQLLGIFTFLFILFRLSVLFTIKKKLFENDLLFSALCQGMVLSQKSSPSCSSSSRPPCWTWTERLAWPLAPGDAALLCGQAACPQNRL